MARKKDAKPPLVPVVQVEVRIPGETDWSATLYADGEVRSTRGWVRFRIEHVPEDWTPARAAVELLAQIVEFEDEDQKRRDAWKAKMLEPPEKDE